MDKLKPDDKNLRHHPEENIEMITESMREFGALRPVVSDDEGRILSGNGAYEAAQHAGIDKVRVVETDGHEIIAVRRRGLTEDQKVRYAIVDNRSGELSSWDTDALAERIEEGLDTRGFFFDHELSRLVGEIYQDEEDAKNAKERAEKHLERERRLDLEMNVVMCPHCYHEWTPDMDGGGEIE